MTKLTIIYFCMPHGGHKIVKEDKNPALSVMMPMGVSVYETSEREVEIATWNMELMGGMFPGMTGEVLSNGAKNLAKSLEGIVAENKPKAAP